MSSVVHPTSEMRVSSVNADSAAEFRELISGCGIYDLRPRTKVVLTGDDRVRWLNGMVTNNVRDLPVGHGVYTFLLNPQGHILADLYAFQRGDHMLVDFDSELREKVLALFDHYIIADDVEVTDVSSKLTAIGVSGGAAAEVLKRAGLVAELGPLQYADIVWKAIGVTLVRGEEEIAPSWQVWMGPEHFDKVWDALIAAGARRCGAESLELFRIAKGIPRYGQDIRERDLPQETRQDRALHFAKGCYIGQEIVERIRSRGAVHRVFTGFLVEGALPPPGTKIQANEKEVGEVTSSAVLPAERGPWPVALGYIRREAMAGRDLIAGDAHLKVSEVPFAL